MKNQNQRLSEILDITMCNAGYYDDWDEIIGDMIDNNVPDDEILDFAKSVEVSVNFVNNQSRKGYIQQENNFYSDAMKYLDQK